MLRPTRWYGDQSFYALDMPRLSVDIDLTYLPIEDERNFPKTYC